MIIIHVSVHMISRMEEYMIPYLIEKSLTKVRDHQQGQSSMEAFESYDCQSVLKVIRNSFRLIILNSFRLIQVGDCWINV